MTRLVSVHVPKTAGFSFQKHLKHLFGRWVSWDYNHTDRPDYKPEKITPVLLAKLRSNRTTVIHGHFFMSKYHHIPNLQRAMWFRDPVQRLLSHYYYWLKSPDMNHPNCKKLIEGALSVLEFAKIPELQNFYARFLNGEPVSDLNWVGIIEDYQTSIDLFYTMYAIGREQITPHENRNTSKKDDEYHLNEADRKAIEAINRKDYEIYGTVSFHPPKFEEAEIGIIKEALHQPTVDLNNKPEAGMVFFSEGEKPDEDGNYPKQVLVEKVYFWVIFGNYGRFIGYDELIEYSEFIEGSAI